MIQLLFLISSRIWNSCVKSPFWVSRNSTGRTFAPSLLRLSGVSSEIFVPPERNKSRIMLISENFIRTSVSRALITQKPSCCSWRAWLFLEYLWNRNYTMRLELFYRYAVLGDLVHRMLYPSIVSSKILDNFSVSLSLEKSLWIYTWILDNQWPVAFNKMRLAPKTGQLDLV